MKRKELWKKLPYITVSGILVLSGSAAVTAGRAAASAQEANTSGDQNNPLGAETPNEAETQKKQPESSKTPATGSSEPAPPETSATEPTPPETESSTPGTSEPQQTEIQTDTQTSTETDTVSTVPETESDTQTQVLTESEMLIGEKQDKKNEKETEDHSQKNANWKTNIIASNAAYLGQLSNLYGITIAPDFAGACDEVEAMFASHLTDPENFKAGNWKDVFAVFIYELKKQTGSGNVSASSVPLLLDIFTQMNAPQLAVGETPEAPDISEVFVEEYPIDEQMARIDRREELLLTADESANALDLMARERIHEQAEQQREALRREQKAQMDRARYEKWLRLKQEKEQRQIQDCYATADLTPKTIEDYVNEHGIDAAGKEEIERYASNQCLQLCAISSAERQIVRASVGNDLSEERVGIVTAAYSLVGKVGYFWGGKSFVMGWDSRWGTPAKVTASGSTSTGMTRGYGLDCSGFTLYCYYNGLNGSDAGIGGHTTSQWNASVMVDQINARPGDLVFYGGPERGDMNHVGAVVGKSDDGGLIVAHCSSSQNGVVVGEAWASGFRHVRTVPALP